MTNQRPERLSTDPAIPRPAPRGFLRRHVWLFLGLAAVPLLALAWAAAWVASLVPATPNVANINKARSEQPSVILSADGQQLAVMKRTDREWVKLADISPTALQALIATEDRRFYEHRGLDVTRTIAAAWHTLGGDREGGSTITQQLARNLYPEEIGRAPTITRKVKEAITALKIERAYSKQEILETYLNTVPFLYNTYGIERAARTYFDKPARDLDVLESATLIGMLKGTRYYNPVLNPERARQRRNIVLAQMVKDGRLAPAQFDTLRQEPLHLNFEQQEPDLGPAPHVTQQLRRWLIDWADRNGYDVHADGLVVRTTIDMRLQELATQALTRQADKLQAIADKAWKPTANKQLLQTFLRETPPYRAARNAGASDEQALKKLQADAALVRTLWQDKTRLQAGFMAIDPASGAVKAWVGSRDFRRDQFDHVEQARRQPGSTFKPFVYGAAFEQGVSPDDMLMDQAIDIPLADGSHWRPRDIEQASDQPMSVRDGLVHSKNTITAQVMQRVGPPRIAQVAHDMGVRQSKLDAVPSLALGTSPVTLKEMVSAYGTIVNNGGYVEPMLVTRVESRRHGVLAEFHGKAPQPSLSLAASQTLLDVMRGVVDRGTGAGIRSRYHLKGDLAGKTGTTQDYTDGWFILMHPQLVGGAWVGFNDNRVTMRNDAWGQGAHNALHIVGDFFQQTEQARLIDVKARFAAPHRPPQPQLAPAPDPLLAPPGDWSGNAVQRTPEQSLPQAVEVAEPPPFPPATRAMGAPDAQRNPAFQWLPQQGHTVELPRSVEDRSQRNSTRGRAIIIQVPDAPSAYPPPPPTAYAPRVAREPDSRTDAGAVFVQPGMPSGGALQ